MGQHKQHVHSWRRHAAVGRRDARGARATAAVAAGQHDLSLVEVVAVRRPCQPVEHHAVHTCEGLGLRV